MRIAGQGWNTGLPELKVELLAADHTPLEGHRFEDADSLTKSGFANVVSWNGESDVGNLEGRAIKLKIYFKNVKLFAFQFVK